ncbi:MAG TPA: undecaprenyl-diphosphate phosphatase [Steroidobacteraceae bacterium]|nr:undecaprenyl-diphosphate phosphatase [Steroidobacteraceae bacterium]
MSILEAIILGLVEGITEFLPVSSTGHLILVGDLLGLHGDMVDRQLIIIQGAAILAVCWEFRARLLGTAFSLHNDANSRRFVLNLVIAALPLAILGLLFEKQIKELLFKPVPVALALVIGGVIILWAERRRHVERIQSVDDLRPVDALKLGAFQALALIPGTSRSGATIIGGLLSGFSRRTAAEFSFFVAIPVLLGATAHDLWKARAELATSDVTPLLVSCLVSFASALAATKLLLRWISRHSFAAFAWYRIVFGCLILLTSWMGLVRW